MVGKLREMTNAGLMDCKKALDRSQRRHRQPRWIFCARRASPPPPRKPDREAKEGVIAQYIQPGGTSGVLVEVNCETDFVAQNETFRAFCDEVAKNAGPIPSADLEADRVTARWPRSVRTSRFPAITAWK